MRFRFVVGFFLVGTFLAAKSAYPTPLVKGEKWADNTTIEVYIAYDPYEFLWGDERREAMREGIERWISRLAAQNITLDIVMRPPGAVFRNFVAMGFMPTGWTNSNVGATFGSGPGEVTGTGEYRMDGQESIQRGYAFLDQDQLGGNMEEIKNVAEHEFGHMLGLADDSKGVVMNPQQTNTPRTGADWNANDQKECSMLYNPNGNPQRAVATKVSGGVDDGYITLNFTFEPTTEEEDPENPEHVSLIIIGIPPAYVDSFNLPDGWISMETSAPERNDPFFTMDGYMTCGGSDLPPWQPWPEPTNITLRASWEEAEADGVPTGVDPALSWDPSSLSFNVTIFLRPGLADCDIKVWAGGDPQIVSNAPFRIGEVQGASMDVSKSQLSWLPPHGSDRYDVVRGDLNVLRSSGGNFSSARCLASNLTDVETFDADVLFSGEGFYYVVRGKGCGPDGTYNSYGTGQPTDRDPLLQVCP